LSWYKLSLFPISVLIGGKTDFGTSTGPESVGNFNGDGKQDLVVVNRTSSNVSALLGVNLPPTLGAYGSLSLVTGENKSLTPSGAPTNTESITAYTSGANASDFTGTLTVDPIFGVVLISNAKQAGTYTVTVKATNLVGISSSETFELIDTILRRDSK